MGYERKAFICVGCVIICFLFNFLPMGIVGIERVYGREVRVNEYKEDLAVIKKVITKESSQKPKQAKVSNVDKNLIVSIQDISISIYQNEREFLPKVVKAKYSNGKTREAKVTWDDDVIDTSKVGNYTVEGMVEGYKDKIKCIIAIEPLENIISKLIQLPGDSYDKTEADRIIERISRIYPGILKGLLDKGIHIKLINTPITYLPEYAYLKGLLPRGWENTGKTWDDVPGVSGNPIAIRIGYSEPGKGHGAVNLELHETAHTVDGYLFNAITGTEEFKDIWRKEVTDLFGENSYFQSYCDEYFAEAFAMYYLDGDHKYELSYKAPLTFKFIENLEIAVK